MFHYKLYACQSLPHIMLLMSESRKYQIPFGIAIRVDKLIAVIEFKDYFIDINDFLYFHFKIKH